MRAFSLSTVVQAQVGSGEVPKLRPEWDIELLSDGDRGARQGARRGKMSRRRWSERENR